jgi:ATP-binding cassette subfamily C protein EexD
MLVGTWKGFIVARSQYERLGELLEQIPATEDSMDLPVPKGNLSVAKVTVIPPGSNVPAVRNVSLNLTAGESLAIVGPSASGKSSLARALLGIWPAVGGKVRLDSADVAAWDRQKLGPHIGYLPQDIELFDGTISENICRFGELDSDKIVAASKLAGVHELILHLPDGYDTQIGATGGVLSGGQRQRIGLARAVYGSPCLLVLDEPNSNLDEQGERQLAVTIHQLKSRGCTVIVITHRTLLLGIVDKILVLQAGAVALYGAREEVMAKLKELPRPKTEAAPGPTIVKKNTNS